MIKAILKWNPEAVEIPISGGEQIQIVPEVNDLLRARRHQYAAFIASEAILVVWDDDKLHLLERASAIEAELIRYVWNIGNDESEKDEDVKITECEVDEESGAIKSEERPVHYYHSVMVGCTLCIVTVLQSLGYQNIALDVINLHRWESLAFLAMTPISVFLSLVILKFSYRIRILVGKISAKFVTVFCFCLCWCHCSISWTNHLLVYEFQVLLSKSSSTTLQQGHSASYCHNPMSCIQGRAGISDHTHHQIRQKGNLHL
jgi:hypothetical protein